MGAVVHIISTSASKTLVWFGMVTVTGGTAVPETALELVHGVGGCVIATHGVVAVGTTVFARVVCMTNVRF